MHAQKLTIRRTENARSTKRNGARLCYLIARNMRER
jgi:hypothetical protein